MKTYKTNVLGSNFFCVDIETTGLDPTAEGSEILEIYIKIMKNNKKIKEYYLQYWGDNWEATKDIHQIPKEEIEFKPKFKDSPEDIALIRALFERCADPNDDMVFMAQYAPFEYHWFMKHLGFSDKDIERLKCMRTCDTRLIGKFLYPDESHSLIPMCQKFEVGFPEGQHDFHRADQDVNAMWELYGKLKEQIPAEDLEEYDFANYAYDFERPHDDKPAEKSEENNNKA